jgi:hypothetical protein
LNPGGTEHQTVAEIMRRWPATVAVFLRRTGLLAPAVASRV